MKRGDPPSRGRWPEGSVRRAPQRADWTVEQARALRRLEDALGREPLDEQAAHWRRQWVAWFLRWMAPEDYRQATNKPGLTVRSPLD